MKPTKEGIWMVLKLVKDNPMAMATGITMNRENRSTYGAMKA